MSLYDHQRQGGKWLAARPRHRGYIGDTPGLGKTRTLICGLDRSGAQRPLIVCPAIVRTHWHREFATCGWTSGNEIVKSYDEIVRGGNPLMKKLIVDEGIDSLIVDEVHYAKHATSKRTLQLLGPNGYARRLPRVFVASGTPIPKNPSELWTVLSSLFPEVAVEHKLATVADFVARFCVVRPRRVRGVWMDKIMPELRNEAEFRELLGEIMLRRTLDDVGLDVPPLDWQTTRVDGAPLTMPGTLEGGEAFDTGARVMWAIEDGALDAIAADPHVARMRRRLGELKIEPALALLRSQLEESDEKVVVFAHHRSVMHGLVEGLREFGVAYVDGDTPQSIRDQNIDRFQSKPECRVFLGQNLACQTGITLTAARRAFLVEPDWTAVVNHQLGHRVARIGQQAERCIAHMICLADTLDEAIINQNIREVRMAASALEK